MARLMRCQRCGEPVSPVDHARVLRYVAKLDPERQRHLVGDLGLCFRLLPEDHFDDDDNPVACPICVRLPPRRSPPPPRARPSRPDAHTYAQGELLR